MKIKTPVISLLTLLSLSTPGAFCKNLPLSFGQNGPQKIIVLYTATASEEGDEELYVPQVAQFAFDEYDKENRTKTNINLIAIDDHDDPIHAKEELEKIVPKEKPIAIIGPIYSNVAMALKDYVSAQKIPLMAIFATHNDLTKNTKYFFRICASDRRLVKSMADFLVPLALKNHLNITAFKDLTDDYSTDLTDAFRYNLNGTKINYSEVLFKGSAGITRLQDLDSKIWNPKKSDIFFLPTRDTVGGHIIAALESDPYMVATIDPVNFISTAKKINSEKTHIRLVTTSQWLPGKSEYSKKIESDFQKHFGRPMNITSALTFDAALTMATAYHKAQEEGIPLVQALSLVHLKGVTGTVVLDNSGERSFSDQFLKEGFIE